MATMNSVEKFVVTEENAELAWLLQYEEAIRNADGEEIEVLLLEETTDLRRTVLNTAIEAELYETVEGVQCSKFGRWADGSLQSKKQMKSVLGMLLGVLPEFGRDAPLTQDELMDEISVNFKGITFPVKEGYLVSLKERFARNQVWSMVGRYLNDNYWALLLDDSKEANERYVRAQRVLGYLSYWNSVVDVPPSLEEMWAFYNKEDFEFKYEPNSEELECISIQAEYTGKSEEDIRKARQTAQEKQALSNYERQREFYEIFGDELWSTLLNVLNNEDADDLGELPPEEVNVLADRMEGFCTKEVARQDSSMSFAKSQAVIALKGAAFVMLRGERYRLMASNAARLQQEKAKQIVDLLA